MNLLANLILLEDASACRIWKPKAGLWHSIPGIKGLCKFCLSFEWVNRKSALTLPLYLGRAGHIANWDMHRGVNLTGSVLRLLSNPKSREWSRGRIPPASAGGSQWYPWKLTPEIYECDLIKASLSCLHFPGSNRRGLAGMPEPQAGSEA